MIDVACAGARLSKTRGGKRHTDEALHAWIEEDVANVVVALERNSDAAGKLADSTWTENHLLQREQVLTQLVRDDIFAIEAKRDEVSHAGNIRPPQRRTYRLTPPAIFWLCKSAL